VKQSALFLFSLAVLPLLTLSACVEIGRDFVRPDPNAITLHRTTKDEIVRAFGPPYSTGQFSKNNQLIDSLHYFYGKEEPGDNVFYKKHCWFYFVGADLVGYSYLTGLPQEQMDFDARKVTSIVKGKTTKPEVLAAFGEPVGFFDFPMTDEKKTVEGDTSIIYAYHRRLDGGFVEKVLEVYFDSKGIAKDVDLEVAEKAGTTPRAPQFD
jgi:hypothetical protein